jgi:uncharacterized radical SAM superfamily Fe-S cluster-containing enzyme
MIKLYWKTLQLKRGITLSIFPTFKCNLDCDYCFMKMPSGKKPTCKESSLEDWKRYIIEFAKRKKTREIYISGGEPTLMPYLSDLTNWCLRQGYHVTIYSNLFKPEAFEGIKLTWWNKHKFRIIATYHANNNKLSGFVFDLGYKVLRIFYNIIVEEVGNKKYLEYSTLKPQENMDWILVEGDRIAPDGTYYKTCAGLYNKWRDQ